MKLEEVTIVRIYCTEAEHKLDRLIKLLHDREQVAGVTTFRGIAGFGRSGRMHEAGLLDMSLDLPLVIEFFDRPEKIALILDHLESFIDPGHLVSWSARANLEIA
jgi:PII-like signaling protein